MANGNIGAKQLIITQVKQMSDEADKYAKSLEDGKSGDLHTISKTLALLVKSNCLQGEMLSAMYPVDFVTKEDCLKQHNSLNISKKSTIKLGPLEFEGSFNPTSFLIAIGILSLFVFVTGKIESWW